ncbi:hypothetical protein [Micromonospora endolithica]|uniref:Uncharacterized protein n=1 Tax=Micromonospora endolithica TaxID=230091 RepID=A0A3A9ZSL5_9ACTN|nr:hypothetical protein [Micromonospora endolithica]RKN50457.1 hypothetical protein D7223_01275 [Micromonospora endolithica]TWJ20857.1 hypothetical protein JD76_00957 [Micromonospora endolithica]
MHTRQSIDIRRPARHHTALPVNRQSDGVDSRSPRRSVTFTTGPRRSGAAAAGVATMAAALTLASIPAPPHGSTATLIVADRSCAVPNPAPAAKLATTVTASAATIVAYPRPAPPVLHDLAHRIAPDACDTTNGRFDVVRLRAWYRHDGRRTTRDIVRWYADNNSGAALTSEYPDPWPGVMHDFWPPGWLADRNLSKAFTSGDFFRYSVHSNSSNRDGDGRLITGIAELVTWHNPAPSGRSLTVSELAHTPGLIAYPRTVDRAGRTGIAVATTNGDGTERYLLILHPTTGHVLAYEHATRTPSDWQPSAYVLLLNRTHADRRWWEPATDEDTTSPMPPSNAMMPRRQGRLIVHPDQPCTPEPATAPEEGTVK